MGSFALDMAYGFPLQRSDDPYVDLAERAVATINEAVLPGRFLVNVLPILKHLPEYIPGGGFHTTAKRWRKLQEDLRNVPFDKTVRDMVSKENRRGRKIFVFTYRLCRLRVLRHRLI